MSIQNKINKVNLRNKGGINSVFLAEFICDFN